MMVGKLYCTVRYNTCMGAHLFTTTTAIATSLYCSYIVALCPSDLTVILTHHSSQAGGEYHSSSVTIASHDVSVGVSVSVSVSACASVSAV